MSSLRDFDRVEDRIRQHRQVEKRAVLLVEGPDDLLVLKHHIPVELIFPADGKPNVLRAIDSLNEWQVTGVRAVIDADFDDSRDDETVLAYDQRDLEAMLIELGVLASVLEHQGSAAKLAAEGGAAAVVAVLCAAALPIARLRQASRREGWGLTFDAVDIASKSDRRTLALRPDRYAAALVQASITTASIDDVRQALDHDEIDHRGPRGRDVMTFAGVALRQRVGTLQQAACEEPRLSAQIRSSGALALERSPWMSRLRRALEAAGLELEHDAA